MKKLEQEQIEHIFQENTILYKDIQETKRYQEKYYVLWKHYLYDSICHLRRYIKGEISTLRIKKDEIIIELEDGRLISYNYKSYFSNQYGLLKRGYEEKFTSDILGLFVEAGNYSIDIGANYGFYSLVMAKRTEKEGKVIAFEPNKSNYMELRKNIKLNQFENIIIPVMAAVSDLEGKTNLYYHQDFKSRSSMVKQQSFFETKQEVDCITLDNYWYQDKKRQRISCIKMDVEGAEVKCLKGAAKLIHEYRPLILVELFEQYLNNLGNTSEEFLEFMKENNYCMFEENKANKRIKVYEHKDKKFHNLLCVPIERKEEVLKKLKDIEYQL